MDLKDSLVKGGVIIVHRTYEGKHQYEVESVMEFKKACEKAFVRRGDKLMQINGMDLQDLMPEELAQLLTEANPMLTVHQADRLKERTQPSFFDEDTLHPVSKESTILSFSMEMRREEGNNVGNEAEGEEDNIEEDGCQAENEEDGQRQDVLIVSMKKTSISVVRGRGCDGGSTCHGCDGEGCVFSDVVMVAESSEVMFVPRGGGSFTKLKSLSTPIEHVATHLYLRGVCSQPTPYASLNPEEMTIYYYKSSGSLPFKGQPVVLNFSNSSCFLRCCKEGAKVFLRVEACDKSSLKRISRSDENMLSFIFYMKTDGTTSRTFESALHSGWFIQIDNTDVHRVDVATPETTTSDESFLFIIR